jgi:anti-anti-sigma factor
MQHRIDAGVLHVTIPGDLASPESHKVQRAIHQVLHHAETVHSGWQMLLLDLTNAKIIDSEGLSLLASLLKPVRARDGKLRITLGDDKMDRLLRFTRFNEYADISRT